MLLEDHPVHCVEKGLAAREQMLVSVLSAHWRICGGWDRGRGGGGRERGVTRHLLHALPLYRLGSWNGYLGSLEWSPQR